MIELLAVIVILAVIALIATPVILRIIENARFGAAKSSAIGYVEASEKGVIIHLMENRKNKITGDCTAKGNVLTCGETPLTLDVKGSLPSSGTITFDKNGNVKSVTDLVINGYKFSYDGQWTGEKIEGEVVPPKEESREPSLETDFGAYVNYEPDESTWEEGKLESYGVATSTQSSQGKFDIYDVGTSSAATGKAKSQSITCYNSSYKNKYNGWRVLDVSSSGVITLIHAGTPECYYHAYGESSASVTLLETASTASSPGTSKAWAKYGNATYAQSVHYMTNEDFNLITYQINKNNDHTITDNGGSSSTCYYQTSSTACGYNHDMIDIGSYYWLASAYATYTLYYWSPNYRGVDDNDDSFGVRPVVVLKSGVKFAADGKDGKSESTAFNLVAA